MLPDRLVWQCWRRHRVRRQVVGFRTDTSTYAAADVTFAEHVSFSDGALAIASRIGRFCRVHGRISHAELGGFCSIAREAIVGGLGRHPLDQWSSHAIFYSGPAPLGGQLPLRAEHGYAGEVLPTRLGHDVWVAQRAIILNGVTVGDGAVVAAGAIVTRDVPAYAVVAGIPARVVRYRFDEALRQALQVTRWWEWPIPKLRLIAAAFDAATPLTVARVEELATRASGIG